MSVSTVENDTTASSLRPRNYWIRLNIAPAEREDAWDLCRVVLDYGGVEVCDCCFAFTSKERWLVALESLRFRFGPEYFEPVDTATVHHG